MGGWGVELHFTTNEKHIHLDRVGFSEKNIAESP